jgi:Anti-sigma factor NepR
MYLAAQRRRAADCRPVRCSTEREIRDFLKGKTDGEDLLHALYDHVLDEPVPERLTALLRR